MAKNLHGKTRSVDSPYLIITQGDWEWRVLKRYQSQDAERANPYARWFVAVKSPMTYGSWEMGDTYIREIPTAVAGQDFPDGGAVRKVDGHTVTTGVLIPFPNR
jgi:hypothetical protein